VTILELKVSEQKLMLLLVAEEKNKQGSSIPPFPHPLLRRIIHHDYSQTDYS